MKLFKRKVILLSLISAGLGLSVGSAYAADEVAGINLDESAALQEKIKARQAELDAEARAADRAKNGYYV